MAGDNKTYRQQLIAEGLRARRLTMRKYNRVKNDLGINDLGRHTPRIPEIDTLKRYTTRQLEVYIEKSQRFRSPSNQYVRLGRSGVTTRQKWERFDQRQQKIAEIEAQRFAKYKDASLPTVGQTVGERYEFLQPPRQRQYQGPRTGYGTPRTPDQIPSEEAMNALSKNITEWQTGRARRKLRDDFLKSVQGVSPVFDQMGDDELVAEIESLQPHQLEVLLNIRDFANNFFDMYETVKVRDAETPKADADKVERQSVRLAQDRATIMGLIQDVKNIPGYGG